VTLEDIRAKLGEIKGDVFEAAALPAPLRTYGPLAAGVVAVVVAFWLGRRLGRRKSTWVEIRRI